MGLKAQFSLVWLGDYRHQQLNPFSHGMLYFPHFDYKPHESHKTYHTWKWSTYPSKSTITPSAVPHPSISLPYAEMTKAKAIAKEGKGLMFLSHVLNCPMELIIPLNGHYQLAKLNHSCFHLVHCFPPLL